MKRKLISLLCAIFAIFSLILCGCSTPRPLTVNEIFEDSAKSLVCIEFENSGAWSKATAVATDYDGEWVTALTCYHAVNMVFSSAQAKFYGDDIEPINAQTYEVVSYDEKLDLALIKIKNADYSGKTVALGNFIKPGAVGDTVYVIGNENGEGITLDRGHIKMLDEVKSYSGYEKPLMRVSVSFTEGYSGGVVVDGNAKIVGIAVANDAQNVNRGYAISASIAKAFITRAGEKYPTFSVRNEEYADGDIFKEKTVVTINSTEYEFKSGKLISGANQYTTFNGKAIASSLSEFVAQIILSQENYTLN